ncbi:hypothetical protein FACS1894166_09430 [Bacilli bacterium]|nr:hypothetical protein FACS1894166_09430 [Bacilli bacterium]
MAYTIVIRLFFSIIFLIILYIKKHQYLLIYIVLLDTHFYRGNMKRTYQPNKARRAKKHGFLSRSATRKGKATIKRRRLKGRHKLTVSDEK